MFAFPSTPQPRGPRPELLPHPIPALFVTPPEGDAGPTFLLARARAGVRLNRRPPSPALLSTSWSPTPRVVYDGFGFGFVPHPSPRRRNLPPPPRRKAVGGERDPYAPYVPPPSTAELLAAVLAPILSAFSYNNLNASLLPSSTDKRRRRQTLNPLALILLLLGGTLMLSAALHAFAFSTEMELEPARTLGVGAVRKPDVGLFLPASARIAGMDKGAGRGVWGEQVPAAVVSPRERGRGFDLHVWDLL